METTRIPVDLLDAARTLIALAIADLERRAADRVVLQRGMKLGLTRDAAVSLLIGMCRHVDSPDDIGLVISRLRSVALHLAELEGI